MCKVHREYGYYFVQKEPDICHIVLLNTYSNNLFGKLALLSLESYCTVCLGFYSEKSPFKNCYSLLQLMRCPVLLTFLQKIVGFYVV